MILPFHIYHVINTKIKTADKNCLVPNSNLLLLTNKKRFLDLFYWFVLRQFYEKVKYIRQLYYVRLCGHTNSLELVWGCQKYSLLFTCTRDQFAYIIINCKIICFFISFRQKLPFLEVHLNTLSSNMWKSCRATINIKKDKKSK